MSNGKEYCVLINDIDKRRIIDEGCRVIRLFIQESMPEYKVGDILFVKEGYLVKGTEFVYADDVTDFSLYEGYERRKAMSMPKDMCRLRLKVVDVSQEYLQDIERYSGWVECGFSRLLDFKVYWSSVIGVKNRSERRWCSNPAVYVIRFERV